MFILEIGFDYKVIYFILLLPSSAHSSVAIKTFMTSSVPSPSPRIMSPMGFAINRQARHVQSVMDENSLYGDEWDNDNPPMSYIKPVPIWLCVFLVIGYIVVGAVLFQQWEQWSYLDSAYFCFITLTTIGKNFFMTFNLIKLKLKKISFNFHLRNFLHLTRH